MDKNKVIKVADNEDGYLEKSYAAYKKNPAVLDSKKDGAGEDNYTKFWRDLMPSYQGSAWCNGFINWIFTIAFGEKAAKKALYTSGAWSYYTPTSSQYFKNNKQWHSTPKVGDIIYFKNSVRIHHVGLVYKVDNTYVYTIEGNTGSGAEVIPNGGGVFKKKYLLTNSNIAGYGRPNYGEDHKMATTIKIGTGKAGMKVTTNLNIRDNAGTADSCVVGSYPLGSRIYPTERSRAIDGVYWFKTDKGFVSGKYLVGWVDDGGIWWYNENGKYPVSDWKEIDGIWYYFTADGYMAADVYIKSKDKNIWYYVNKDGAWDTRKDVKVKPRNVVK